MRVGIDTLLIIIGAMAVFLALNIPPTSVVDSTSVLPCINGRYLEVPDGYDGRIPGRSAGQAALRPRLANELVAKNVTVRRGWPLSIQNDEGFLYELEGGQSWFGLPDSQPQEIFTRFSVVAVIVNGCIVILPAAMLCIGLWLGRRRFQLPSVM